MYLQLTQQILLLILQKNNKMEIENSEELERYISNIFSKYENLFESKNKDAILHYLNYEEYEMAFELLFLELINNKINPKINIFECEKIAVQLKLNEHTIFDDNFWIKFKTYLNDCEDFES
jgi:hypothetical protein